MNTLKAHPIPQNDQLKTRKLVMVLGIPIDNLNMAQALDRIEAFIQVGRATGKSHQIATINADFVVKALNDPELRFLLQEADMATADGMPLVWGARLLGVRVEGRVAGSDLVPALAERAAQKGYSIYFLGAAPGVALQAAEAFHEKHPDLIIAGVNSPPYSSVLEMDEAIVEDIKAAQPDILLVAFGNPKQEKWIGMYHKRLQVPVMIGVGATLDFIAGYRKRAPNWMQQIGLEWFYRLLQEPTRLWQRYVHDLFIFGPFFLRQLWVMRRGTNPTATLPKADIVIINNQAILTLQGRLTIDNSQEVFGLGIQALEEADTILVDLEKVDFLDSSAIGALVGLAKRARDAGGDVALVSAPALIQRTLSVLSLTSFFVIYDDLDSATNMNVVRQFDHLPADGAHAFAQNGSWTVLIAPRRLDASNAFEVRNHWESMLHDHSYLILDFSETVLLASAGLAVLARLDRLARETSGEVRVTNCSTDVLRVIELTRFDKVLSLYPDLNSAMV